MQNRMKSTVYLSAIVILAGFFFVSQARATTVPFPGLTGEYELVPGLAPDFGAPTMRSIDFVLPAEVTAIEQLTFVLSGQWQAGEISCNTGFEFPEISPVLPPIAIYLTSSAYPGDFFHATIEMPDGPFENLTADFTSCCPPGVLDFDLLIGSEWHADLSADLGIIGICSFTIDTYGSLDEVALQVTGPVPTETSSWGGIKSLYR